MIILKRLLIVEVYENILNEGRQFIYPGKDKVLNFRNAIRICSRIRTGLDTV